MNLNFIKFEFLLSVKKTTDVNIFDFFVQFFKFF